MWKPSINFFTLHYAYIFLVGLVGFAVILPYGNVAAIDAFFFGTSASTESGLNTFDVKNLKTYQQLVIYVIPTIAHMAVINIVVIATRLYWFERRLKQVAPSMLRWKSYPAQGDRPGGPLTADSEIPLPDRPNPVSFSPALENTGHNGDYPNKNSEGPANPDSALPSENHTAKLREPLDGACSGLIHKQVALPLPEQHANPDQSLRITFDSTLQGHRRDSVTIYSPPLAGRDRRCSSPTAREGQRGSMRHMEDSTVDMSGSQPISTDIPVSTDEGSIQKPITPTTSRVSRDSRWRSRERLSLERATSIERVASSIFVLGQTRNRSRELSKSDRDASRPSAPHTRVSDLPQLSSQVTIGRNSQFHGLSAEERELLGGIEYRSLKLLLWICIGYFVGLHVLGVICLVPWIQHAPSKYTDYLDEVGQNKIWWAFYSAQTMANNLGFTLTPDSMVHFRDATFPMLVMTFLAYTGYNFYPIFLRLLIWSFYKLVPKNSALRGPLAFLLEHPRRCCMLLFSSRPTWILFGILFGLNFLDVLLLIVLDLDNPSVTELPLAQRILAAIFQAASSRHTGTSTFDLSGLNPAAQFSLLVMMYISVYPIALTIRASNTYEERALGKYAPEQIDPEEAKTGGKYVMAHMRNQLSFDLWYIFLGIFLICIAESDKIMDTSQPEFSVFPIFFEVTSAYGNVGLSLGHPDVQTSLSGQFSVCSKLVICAMMIRGRHRGLPYEVDRAIQLPSERLVDDNTEPLPSRRPLLTSEVDGEAM
ncbi:Potassium transport protein [Fusarium keratoplasticum]|uniref:Potassium transport protein n=1 Tax=Fusarium keratoplasticum TaxID=1328300 RepID=A0ACC0R6S3_9HYPO|nr:Potassium transport protein [Fusarium keratoplasticum]KAI8676060.1 Potassium transport protein [Fusarium keratoplasticum]